MFRLLKQLRWPESSFILRREIPKARWEACFVWENLRILSPLYGARLRVLNGARQIPYVESSELRVVKDLTRATSLRATVAHFFLKHHAKNLTDF